MKASWLQSPSSRNRPESYPNVCLLLILSYHHGGNLQKCNICRHNRNLYEKAKITDDLRYIRMRLSSVPTYYQVPVIYRADSWRRLLGQIVLFCRQHPSRAKHPDYALSANVWYNSTPLMNRCCGADMDI